VGIARTLLKNPPALDTETEHEIQDALARAGEGRTVITIAHRLSTIADADRIIVLEKGLVVEDGKHDDLLAQNGRIMRCGRCNNQARNRGAKSRCLSFESAEPIIRLARAEPIGQIKDLL